MSYPALYTHVKNKHEGKVFSILFRFLIAFKNLQSCQEKMKGLQDILQKQHFRVRIASLRKHTFQVTFCTHHIRIEVAAKQKQNSVFQRYVIFWTPFLRRRSTEDV